MSGVTGRGLVGGFSTLKDNTVKVTLYLNELPTDKIAEIISYNNKEVKFYITNTNIVEEQKEAVDSIKIESDEISPSKRMRNIIFRLWEQNKENYDDPDLHYKYKMGQLCKWLKEKLI